MTYSMARSQLRSMRRTLFHRARVLLILVLLLGIILPAQTGAAGSAYQVGTAQAKAQELLARLTPQEKVGQLFLVTFEGTGIDAGSMISSLVTKYHIGGVMLTSASDNLIGPDNTTTDLYRITTSLQTQAWQAFGDSPVIVAGESEIDSRYIPLFIGISQEGGGYPYDQILNGVTVLPDQMAIGATWKPELAQQVGAVMGTEFSVLGFNLFFGPSLDVLDTIPGEDAQDLSVRTFGGDPYWVGLMGQAYIQGLHDGSAGRMTVIARHFPGRGGSDRSTEEEVSTVRKSLEQLKQIELAPFFAVTAVNENPNANVDGLLVSHIRYQGFQGNIRATTRPISFDSAALDQMLQLAPLSEWRAGGGILVSDDLGSQALRRFYETTGQVYDPRQVTRNAFLAGNDLLYVNNLSANTGEDEVAVLARVLASFEQKYKEDRAFAERVDASVLRLLTRKYEMYPEFTLDEVLPDSDALSVLGNSQEVTFEVARQGVTMISPDATEFEAVLPRPPGLNENIVFITDGQSTRQCTRCPEQATFEIDGLEKAVNRLYGIDAGGQVYSSRLASYSMQDLLNMLNRTTTEITPLETDLRSASWIIFSLMKPERSRPESQSLQRFLSERPDLFRNKRVIVFSFGAPYYLDATDISKLTAYYGMYSKAPAFIDVAARVLFQELTPAGRSPVNIPGVGYELINVTAPDADQVIPLSLDVPDPEPVGTGTPTPLPTAVPVFRVGDVLPLRTGVIVDNNGNVVPDGTVVRFLFTVGGETGTVQQIETTTTGGIARASYRISMPGMLEVHVVSDPASTSQILRLDTAGGVITAIAPTAVPTFTPTPTQTLTPTPTPTQIPVEPPPARPLTLDWLYAMLLTWGSAAAVFALSRRINLRWRYRTALLAAVGGLAAYLVLVMQRSTNEELARALGTTDVLAVTLLGIVIGFWAGFFWRRWMENRARAVPERPTGPRSSTGPKSPTG